MENKDEYLRADTKLSESLEAQGVIMLREKAKAQLKELNERLRGEHYESVLDDIYDTDDETYADFNCETFSGTYLIKENRIGNSISIWDINEQGDVVGYLKN